MDCTHNECSQIDDTKVCKIVKTSTNPLFELASCKTLEGDVLLKGHIKALLDDPSCDPNPKTLVAKSGDHMFDPDGAAKARLLVKERIIDLIGSIKHIGFFGDCNTIYQLLILGLGWKETFEYSNTFPTTMKSILLSWNQHSRPRLQ